MPKTLMDWMGVAGLWLGTAILAIRSGDLALIEGAPEFLASRAWGYVPFTLVSLSAVIFARHLFARAKPAPVPLSHVETILNPIPEFTGALKQAPDAPSTSAPKPKQEMESGQPGGRPDTKLVPAFEYVLKASAWAERHNAKGPMVVREMADKLHMRELTAWGRRQPDGSLEPIPWHIWATAKPNPGNGCAVVGTQALYYDVQFDLAGC